MLKTIPVPGKASLSPLLLLLGVGVVFLLSASATAETDSDGDGYTDTAEAFIGTDPEQPCNDTTIKDDEQTDAWPPDFNDDKTVDVADVVLLRDVFGSTSGDGVYDPRFDLTTDGEIDVADVTQLRAEFGNECEPPPAEGGTTFLETFDGNPSAPKTFYGAPDWDISIAVRDNDPLDANDMMAMHGPDCGPPGPNGIHPVEDFDDQVFICREHMMTAMDGPQGQIFLTPNAMVDFSEGEAIIRFDGSSLITSTRDWRTLWIQPWDTNLTNPQAHGPKDAVFWQSKGTTVKIFRNFDADKDTSGTGMQSALKDLGYEPSATRRDTYEVRISRSRLHVTINTPNGSRVLKDMEIDPPLTWDRGIVQFGHQVYSPKKGTTDDDCSFLPECPGPNTWHWDNVYISPAQPFTIIRGPRYVKGGTNAGVDYHVVEFAAPAPADSLVRFIPTNDAHTTEISVDGGKTWQTARLQPSKGELSDSNSTKSTVFHPIPEGATSILVRAEGGKFIAADINVWSLTAPEDAQTASLSDYLSAKAVSNFGCSIDGDKADLRTVLADPGRERQSRRFT